MLGPWYAATLLAWEAADVIGLRVAMLARGGDTAFAEANLMISEKVAAGVEAFGALMMGKTPDDIIQRYREHVAANATRLALASAS